MESVIHVDGLLTALCARNVEKALLKMPGVHQADANSLNSTATVHYDETQVTLAQLQAAVADCGYVCAGEALPDHMAPASPAVPMDHALHAGHAMPMAQPAAAAPPIDHSAHAEHAMPGALEDHAAHGGKPGMTAAAMERDMRNRFFMSLILTVPVFLFSHLATQFANCARLASRS